jgi:SAM-dependent methyltransferase
MFAANTNPSTSWEQAVLKLREDPAYRKILQDTYLGPDLVDNAERFFGSEEFRETVELIRHYRPITGRLLDLGSGNGISAVAFARLGYQVTAAEPDPGKEVGRGAIQRLKDHYKLEALEVSDAFGESLPFASETFDLVYVRQAMHHAQDLELFIAEAARILRRKGLLLTVRDHVVFHAQDKELFLASHPLQAHYGGENAFTEQEYVTAFRNAGLEIRQVLRLFDSVINFAPMSRQEVQNLPKQLEANVRKLLAERFGKAADLPWFSHLAYRWICRKAGGPYDERRYPGRMYTFVVEKS